MRLLLMLFFCLLISTINYSQISGNSLAIRSAGNIVQVKDTGSLTVSNTMTVEAWVYNCCTNLSSDDASTILQKGWCGTNYGYIFLLRDEKLEWQWNLPGFDCDQTSRYLSLNNVVPANQWTHVAAVHTPTSVILYVNGQPVPSSKIAGNYGNILPTAEPLRIGGYKKSPGNGGGLDFPLLGRVDELRIWNVARSANEINSSYQTALTGNESGLVAYYMLDENGTGAGVAVQNSAVATTGSLNGVTVGNSISFKSNDSSVVCYTGTPPAACLGIPVPLKLLSFKSANLANNASFSWKIAEQFNVKEFELQKSFDGINFSKLVTIQLAKKKDYSYNTNFNELGRYYFRLKIIDKDNSYFYSETQTLNFGNSFHPIIYPTTVDKLLIIKIPVGQKFEIRIMGNDGRIYYSKKSVFKDEKINTALFTSGIYYIQSINNNGIKLIQKIIIQHQ